MLPSRAILMMRIDTNSQYPLYLQIADILRDDLKNGVFSAKQALPTERMLSEKLKVNRRTIAKALDILRGEGLLQRIKGRGSFIAEKEEFLNIPQLYSTLKIVGIAIPICMENSHAVQMSSGAAEVLHQNNIQTIRFSSDSAEYEREIITRNRTLLAGIIHYPFFNAKASLANINYFLSLGLPVVEVGNLELDNSCSLVRSNDEAGAAAAVEYFIRSGHKRIIFFPAKSDNIQKSMRRAGYEEAMKKAGLKIETSGYEKQENCPEMAVAFEYTLGLFSKKTFPTAILAQNDMIATGIYRALNALGIKVPDEVELMGFGNDIEASAMYPESGNPVSTVAVDRKAIGRKAAELLMKKMANPSAKSENEYIPTKIIHRNTSRGAS